MFSTHEAAPAGPSNGQCRGHDAPSSSGRTVAKAPILLWLLRNQVPREVPLAFRWENSGELKQWDFSEEVWL